MNRTARFLAPASQVISAYCPKVHLLAIPHRHLNVAASASLLTKSSLESCQKHAYMDSKLPNDVPDIALVNEKEDICHALQKMQVNENANQNVNSNNVDLGDGSKECIKKSQLFDKNKYKELRRWTKIKESNINGSDGSFALRLISFNILAQELLETHDYLYYKHNKEALPWEKRKPLIVQEILESDAHMVCLQEVQEDHLRDFLIPFQEKGFTYLYKKRTNDKRDGLLLLYKENLFNLIEFSKLELFQTYIEPLNRDNVALIAKFSVKSNPEVKFVVATTHLLYNPRRSDVRLGQVQVLFAEIERISFIENTPIGPRYLPILLSGDFNLEPYSGVYRFITEGSIEFEGRGRNLEKKCFDYYRLSNSLIPPHLHVTDECQHFNVLSQRLSGKGCGKVMLRNTESEATSNCVQGIEEKSLFDLESRTYQKVEIAEGHFVTFSSGLLTHPFQFKSVYDHANNVGRNEATTFQDKWITVDYIFYSNIKAIERYMLPTDVECREFLYTIPNSIVGSDHLCIGATFEIKKS